jgi:hypothetical protein
MSNPSAYAHLKSAGITPDGARQFRDGSSENVKPEVLAALTDANLSEAELEEFITNYDDI